MGEILTYGWRGSASSQARQDCGFIKLHPLTQRLAGNAQGQARPERAEAASLGAQPRLPGTLPGHSRRGAPEALLIYRPTSLSQPPRQLRAPRRLFLPGAGPAPAEAGRHYGRLPSVPPRARPSARSAAGPAQGSPGPSAAPWDPPAVPAPRGGPSPAAPAAPARPRPAAARSYPRWPSSGLRPGSLSRGSRPGGGGRGPSGTVRAAVGPLRRYGHLGGAGAALRRGRGDGKPAPKPRCDSSGPCP